MNCVKIDIAHYENTSGEAVIWIVVAVFIVHKNLDQGQIMGDKTRYDGKGR